MSIDKESDGLPHVDLQRRTTKVNMATVIGVILFLVVMAALILWFARRHG